MRIAVLFLLSAGVLANYAQVSLAAEHVGRTIFKCKVDGVTTFSDLPCGQDAQSQSLDPAAINTYAPPARLAGAGAQERPPPSTSNKPPKPPREDRSEAKRKESCARYARSLKEIRSKLRSGYTVQEGERLRVRAEKLRSSQRQERCS